MRDITSLECPVELVVGRSPCASSLKGGIRSGYLGRGVREPRASFEMILKKLRMRDFAALSLCTRPVGG
jgi:hypothetical protein